MADEKEVVPTFNQTVGDRLYGRKEGIEQLRQMRLERQASVTDI